MKTKIEIIAQYLKENRAAGHTRAIMKGALNFKPKNDDDTDSDEWGLQQTLTILAGTEITSHTLTRCYKLPDGVKVLSIEQMSTGVPCIGALILDNSAIAVLAKEVEEMRKKLEWESRHPFKAWWKRVKEKLQQLDVDHLGKQSLTS